MSGKLTRWAYRKLIEEDIAWLKEQPRTLERDHIVLILERSEVHEYGEEQKLTPAEMDELAGYPLDHELMAKFTFKEGEEITPKTLHEALERYHQERKK